MTSQLGKQTITTNILPDNSLSKGNQTMKFGLLVKDNLINIFLEKTCTKCNAETNSRQCVEKSKLSIYPWINGLKFYKVQKSLKIPNILKLNLLLPHKVKKRRRKLKLKLVSLPQFSHYFYRKIFFTLYSIN